MSIRKKGHCHHNTQVEGTNNTEGGGVGQRTDLSGEGYRENQQKLFEIIDDQDSLQCRWWPRTIHPARSGPATMVSFHGAQNFRGS